MGRRAEIGKKERKKTKMEEFGTSGAAALPLLAGDHRVGNWVHKNPVGILIRTQEQEERSESFSL